MKILAVCQALDLSYKGLGITPAWWQILKSLHELGDKIVAVPYYGKKVDSLWWRTYENPNSLKNLMYNRIENASMKLPFYKDQMDFRQRNQRIIRFLVSKFVRPRWKKLLVEILEKEKDVDAVIVFTVPLNQFKGVPTAVKKEFDIPIVFYDGDTPASLPKYGGLSFSYYEDADLTEYDAFVINSKGAATELSEMGAERVHTIYWGADPSVYSPVSDFKQDIDVAFYGIGSRLREEWMIRMLTKPSTVLTDAKFAVAGKAFNIDLGRTVNNGVESYRGFSCRSKINLNIVRKAHAEVYASSISRPFELACLGCCIVSNPYNGLDEWFDIGKEIFIAKSEEEAVELYKWLIWSDEDRRKIGEAARQRVLREHTFLHRAKELKSVIDRLS